MLRWLWLKVQYTAEVAWGLVTRPDDVPSEVLPGLFIGGFVRTLPALVPAVVDLCAEHQDRLNGVAFTLWAPIADAEYPGDGWLHTVVREVDNLRIRGVYVHCAEGKSRSGMVVVAYVMMVKRINLDEALAFVQSKRSIVQPNPSFMTGLRGWKP